MPFLSVGRAGLEPAYSLLIGQEPSPFWPPASGSESQHRTDDLRPMKPALWPTELSRHGWPPRDRTAQIPAYQTGPVDQLGRGQQMVEESSLRRLAASHPASNGRLPPGRFTIQGQRAEHSKPTASRRPAAFGAAPATLAGSLSAAEGTRIERVRANPATRFQRGTLPLGQPSIRGERAIRTPHRSAHSLAARPGALARSLSVRREGLAPSRPFRATGS